MEQINITVVLVRDPNILDGQSGQAEVSDTITYVYRGHLDEQDALVRVLAEENSARADTDLEPMTLTELVASMNIRVDHMTV